MRWVIEYWNPTSKNVSYFSSLDGSWREAPEKDVIYVWFFVKMRGKQYVTKLKGKDYYFFDGKRFGGFNDEIISETSHDGPGSYFEPADEKIIKTRTPDHIRPGFVKDEDIKEGVWVTEPCATRLGLSIGSQTRKLRPELRRYKS